MSRLRFDPPGTRPWLLDRRGREQLRAADDAAAEDAKVAAFSGAVLGRYRLTTPDGASFTIPGFEIVDGSLFDADDLSESEDALLARVVIEEGQGWR